MRKLIFGAVAALLLGGAQASATSYCDVLPTRDGFVALRDAPRSTAKLIRRLKSGDTVQIDSTARPQGGWVKVFYTGPDRSQMQPGWVNRRLIAKECG
jgi:Bacterial SH3 domain